MNMGNLFRLSNAKTRSISPENLTGEPGKGGMATLENGSANNAARELGQGWKVNPFIVIKPGETFTMAEIDGPGAIQHIWMTPTGNWRIPFFVFIGMMKQNHPLKCLLVIFLASAGVNIRI